jgi:hypothetical protein
MNYNQGIQSISIDCNDDASIFFNGTSILNSMRTIPSFKGISGNVHFDQRGSREGLFLEILELGYEGLKQVGTWNSDHGIQTYYEERMPLTPETNPFRIKPLKILTVLVSNLSDFQ